jgi:hypothetical protein
LPLRFKIGGTIVTIIGLVLYFWRGFDTIMLALSAIGIVALLIGFLWKPEKKTETTS